MLNKGLFTSNTDLWATPQDLFDKLNDEFHFTLDVCAIPENAKCEHYYSPEQDGLLQHWEGTVWCNPPYGREISKWIEKAYQESRKSNTAEQIQNGFTNTYYHMVKYGLSEVV